MCYIISSTFWYPLFFIFRKIFFGIYDDTDAFFLFLFQKDFDIFHKGTDAFCFSFFGEDFDIFQELLFEAFLCFSIVSGWNLKKKKNGFFILRFYVVCFYSSEFSSSESSLSDSSEEISISFFLWQHIYILLKTLADDSFYMFGKQNISKLQIVKCIENLILAPYCHENLCLFFLHKILF